MLNCPYCDAELGAASDRLRGGRCPRCGSILSWGDDTPVAKDEDALPMSEIVRTLVQRGESQSFFKHTVQSPAFPTASPAPPAFPVAPSPVSVPKTPTTAFGVNSTIAEIPGGIADLPAPPRPPEAIDDLWRGALTVASMPSMTLKAVESEPETPASDVLVRPFRVGQPGDPSGQGAEYELQEIIGEGGVGFVYAARQASIDRIVAIKMLKDEFAHKRDHRNKFLTEAVVTGELDHPNIVPIYDLGTSDLGSLFYAMKRVRGTPWSECIRQKTLAENLRILMSVADAIAFAHSRGVVHRDLKPENVMLGSFGEVLVMDWGIALSTNLYIKSNRISQSASMGGTPAYMAPEMATGPLEAIGPASDVYLLGATLFEIVAGKPPHQGQDVMACLYAAARNEIAPTDQKGELLTIALQAMSTKPAERHASVQAFQAAIHEYQSHSESTTLSERAEKELAEARQSGDYQDFSRALFAFQEAHSLWLGNDHAQRGELEAKLAYAELALKKEDFDLGISLLDERQPQQASLRKRLTAAQKDRNARQSRIKALRRTAIGMAALIFVLLGGGLLFIGRQYQRIGLINKDLSQTIGDLNLAQTRLENEKKNVEAANGELTKTQSRLLNSNVALVAAKQSALTEAQIARQEEQNAAAASYRAQIGVAAERIDNNAFRDAQRLLNDYYGSQWSYFRHWEWGYLKRLCERQGAELEIGSRIESLASTSDGNLLAAGTASGQVLIFEAQYAAKNLRKLQETSVAGPIEAIAFSADGGWLAVGGQFDRGAIHLFRKGANGYIREAKSLMGHGAGVLSLTFSPSGNSLVSTSQDGAVHLWPLQPGVEERSYFGHSGPVWSAAFSPDGSRIITGGDDATVRIWKIDDGDSRIYRGHASPVYSVAYAPQGNWIASAGRDHEIHLWKSTKDLRIKYDDIARELVQQRNSNAVAQTPAAFHKPDIRLAGHTADVHELQFSTDGHVLLSGSDDNTVRHWEFTRDPQNPKFVTVLRGHGGWVRGSVLGADPRYAVSGSLDGSVKMWDTDTYEEVRALRGHEDVVNWATYSRDGHRIVTAGRDRRALLWSRDSTQPLMVFDEGEQSTDRGAEGLTALLKEGHEYLATSAAFLPDGRRIITSAGDGTVRIWDQNTGGQLHRLRDTGTLGTLAVSPDGRWLLTGSKTTDVHLWRLDDLSASPQLLGGHKGDVAAAAFSPLDDSSQSKIVTGDVLGNVWLWNLETRSGAVRAEGQLTGHSSGYGITGIEFTPDGRRVFSASQDHTVLVHDAITRERASLVLRHPGSVRAMDLSADGRFIATLTVQGKDQQRAVLWDARSGAEIRTCDLSLRGQTATSIVFHPQQPSVLLTSTADRRSRLWRWDISDTTLVPMWSGKELRGAVWSGTISSDGARLLTIGGSQARLFTADNGELERTFSPHGPVTAAAFSPLGKYVATSSTDGDVKLWSADPAHAEYGKVVLRIVRPHGVDGVASPVQFVSFAPRETATEVQLITAGDDGTARIWQIADGAATQLAVVAGHTARVRSAEFSPDGQWLLTASDDHTARLWDANTAKPAPIAAGQLPHPEAVLFAAFSPDGTQAITGCNDNNAYVWDLKGAGEGRPRLVLQGHTAAVTSTAVSPDGRRAVTGSQDGIAKLWDLESGKEILSLKRHAAELTSVHFAPDGSSILTSSRDQTVLEWPAAKIGPAVKLSSPRLEISRSPGTHAIDPRALVYSPDTNDLGGFSIVVKLSGSSGNPSQLATLALVGGEVTKASEFSEIDTAVSGVMRFRLANGASRQQAEWLMRAIAVNTRQPLDQPLEIHIEVLDAAGERISQAQATVQAADDSQQTALAAQSAAE